MSANLEGKVAVVTGSTRGIGRAIADALAVLGAEVIITARREKVVAAPPRHLISSILSPSAFSAYSAPLR